MPTTPSTSRLRWGILGTARINAELAPFMQIEAVASRSLYRANQANEKLKAAKAYGSYEDLLADDQINTIYISLPNHLHHEWTLAALRAGKHVLCEKPLATNTADVRALVDAARKADRILAEAFMYRHHAQTRAIEASLGTQEWGALRHMHVSFHFSLPTNAPNIRLDPSLGGGALLDIGCYATDACLVFAKAAGAGKLIEAIGRQQIGPTGVNEAFAALLRFSGGATASFDCSFRGPRFDRMQIVCANASITVGHPFKPGVEERLQVVGPDLSGTLIVDEKSPYQRQIEDFERAVATSTSPLVTLAQSEATASALEQLAASAARH